MASTRHLPVDGPGYAVAGVAPGEDPDAFAGNPVVDCCPTLGLSSLLTSHTT